MNSFGYTPFPFLSSSVIIFGKKDPSDIQRTAIDNNDDDNDNNNNNNEEEAEDRHIYSVNCNGGWPTKCERYGEQREKLQRGDWRLLIIFKEA